MQLIQIAESEDKQLFLYVYQPADSKIDLQCKAVSISVGFSSNGQGLDPKLYDLILVSSEGVFDKYLVNGFTLPDEAERYYNIVSLYREFNAAVDPAGDKTEYKDIVCKSYAVGQQWCAYTVNDKLVYEMNTFRTMDVEYIYAGKIECPNGVTIGNFVGINEYTDVHFIAFNSVDFDILTIYDADVFIKERVYKYWIHNTVESENHITYPNGEEFTEDTITLSSGESKEISGTGIFALKYKYKSIMSSKDFIENLEKQDYKFDENDREKILSSQWVFSYKTTSRVGASEGVWYTYTKTEILASVLRIHFMDVSGKIYDLGVVSDIIRSGSSPGGFDEDLSDLVSEFEKIFYKILALVGVIVIIILLFTAFPVIKVVFSGFVFIIKMIWDLFTLPFRWIFKK